MSDTKKMIQINPELFKFNGNKTRKNIDKKEKPIIPFIKAGNLKDKFLNRIKQHKSKELLEKNKELETENSDEFYGALKYLSEIPKKQKKEHIHHNKTIKKETNIYSIPHVELELPPELLEQNLLPVPHQKEEIKLNYRIDSDIPHGCLRGGQKPTYRTWQNLTRKNNEIDTQVSNVTNNINNITVTRDERLQMIKNKLKNLEKEAIQTEVLKPVQQISNVDFSENIEPILNTPLTNNELVVNRELKEKDTKKMIKKTIRKKYTLGKSRTCRKVSVLIKDKQSRKQILNAHKELKKTPISDIKNYLKKHGIIKAGSSIPNDVARKTFEYSRLAGEVHNTNKETLLHNFMNNDDVNENN